MHDIKISSTTTDIMPSTKLISTLFDRIIINFKLANGIANVGLFDHGVGIVTFGHLLPSSHMCIVD